MSSFWLAISLFLAPLALLLLWQAFRRRRAEARATRMAQELSARSRQFNLVAQELRGLGLSLMGRSSAPPDPQLETHARALLCLAADVQDVAACQAAPRAVKDIPTPVAPLLRQAIEQVSLTLAPGRRAFRLGEGLEGAVLLADPRALRGAVVQVLTRAVRHSREGDPIVLQLVRSAETVSITVEDEGTGLAAEDLGTAGDGQGSRGLNLGLMVARQLLHAHEGELTLEAVQGIGARAWLTLPRRRLLAEDPAPSRVGA
jgi:signal transduction histidine kinase